MSALQFILGIGLIAFFVGALVNLRSFLDFLRSIKGLKLIIYAWIFLALSHLRLIGGVAMGNNALVLGAGHYLEVASLVAAMALIFLNIMRYGLSERAWRLGTISLFFYSMLGLISIAWAPASQIVAWKAAQLIVLVLVSVASTVRLSSRGGHRILVEVTYGIITVIMVSAAIGALMAPDLAFKSMYAGGGGTFGVILFSVWPHMHPNSLGLYAALLVIVALRRVLDKAFRNKRLYYAGLGVLALSVQFASQSRGSIVALAVGLMMLSIFWSRVRWVTFAFVGIFILAGAYGLVMQERMDVVDQTEDYLRRGQTEQQIESMSGRTSLWSIGMEMVADSPLFGHGYQTGARFGGSTYGLQIGTNLHNSHFQVLIDSGLVGYTLWLVFLVSGGWLVLRRRKNDSSAHGDHVTFNVEIAVLSVMLLVRTLIGHAMVALDIGIMFFLSAVMHAYRLSPQDRGEKMPKSLTQDPHKDPRCDNFIKKRPNFIKKRPR